MSTKDSILQAATRLFAEHGYEGMTMKEIAKEVGIKAPSLYAFFKSKEDIFLHIYRETIARHLHLTINTAELFRQQSAKAQLEQLLHAVFDYQLQEADTMKIFIRILLFPPASVKEDIRAELFKMEQSEHALFAQILQAGMDRGEIKQGDCDARATAMVCLMDGLFWEMQRYDEATFRKRLDVAWEQFWLGVAG